MKKPIYVMLDVWVWIRIARGYYGKDEKYKRLADHVVNLSENNVRFPITIFHLMEAQACPKEEGRENLISFMLKISRGYSTAIWTDLTDDEAENAVASSLGLETIDLKSKIYCEVNFSLFGSEWLLSDINTGKPLLRKENPDIYAFISSALVDPEKVSKMYADKGFFDLSVGRKKLDLEEAEAIDKARTADYSHKFPEKSEDLAKARILSQLFTKDFFFRVRKYGDVKDVLNKAMFSNGREGLDSFLKSMPSYYTFFCLNHVRNSDKSRKIHPNDVYDLAYMNVGIPYCDVVIGENMWVAHAKRYKLDELYTTLISSDPFDLLKIGEN